MKNIRIAVTALVLSASSPALAQDRSVFGATQDETAPRAVLTFDGITPFFAIGTGWITSNGEHMSGNPNYLTGTFDGSDYRSFFSFALGALAPVSPYTSATLTVKTGETAGTGPFRLDFYDVSASFLALDQERIPVDAAGQALYADLGSGTSYGFGIIPGATAIGDTVTFTLNQAFLDRVNRGLAEDFSIGGTLLPGGGGGAVPEPATWALMILGFGAIGGAMRRRPAKVSVRFA